MLKKVYVEIPELPTVEKYVLLDRPEIIYINLSCNGEGIFLLVQAETTENDKPMTPA